MMRLTTIIGVLVCLIVLPLKLRKNISKKSQRRRRKRHLEERVILFTKIIIQAAEGIGLRPPNRKKNKKGKKRKAVTASTNILLDTAKAAGTAEQRKNMWDTMITEHQQYMTDIIKEEDHRWKKETANIEHDLRKGDWTSRWR